ncbi:MAG: ATP-dependent protease [Myxococcales bacterium 68-20]|mgnify:FL=1|nr:MAG: ATP-dependent protease [Myxococcales bacterium 68-20]
MLAIAQSAVLVGITSFPVRVEVQAERGIPTFELVGLAEAAVRESRVRVKSALAGVGVDISECRVTVNLAPADVKKSGSSFDLAIALGTLVALGAIPEESIAGVLLLGELSLNGGMQSLRGVVAHLLGAKERGVVRAIVPRANEREAALVDGVEVELASTLGEIVDALRGKGALRQPKVVASATVTSPIDDLSDVRGQHGARRALEICASGAHNLLMMGPPGAGKTMLARRLPGILPALSREEALEVIAIHGVAGLLGTTSSLVVERPFRAPHHTASDVALVGGGEHSRPGEVSLSHHGVLFLDELSELRRTALEALRQPLEDGVVTVCRMRMTVTFPARPMLIGATNPCPCGNYGDGTPRCGCGFEAIRQYRRRLSGPLLDRLDFHVVLPRVDLLELQSASGGESSAVVRARVEASRATQRERWRRGEVSVQANAHLSQRDVERVCALDATGKDVLAQAVERRGLSARAYGKVLRLARTIADMDGATAIAAKHVMEAVLGRVLDRDQTNGRPFETDAA